MVEEIEEVAVDLLRGNRQRRCVPIARQQRVDLALQQALLDPGSYGRLLVTALQQFAVQPVQMLQLRLR
jgi:hypothetical protein